MASVKKVSYFKMKVPNRPGQGARALGELQKAGINLVAFSGFPQRGGAQMDFIPAKPAAFADRVGEGSKLMSKLAAKRINVIAIDAVCAGSGRYGAILWVSPGQYGKAARALGAR